MAPDDSPEQQSGRLSPEAVARRSFGTSFRGYDQLEVRAYLGSLADELREMRDREADLRARLQAAESRTERAEEVDEHRLTQILGEETARVLSAAREAAAEIRAKAEESVARLLREAQDEVGAMRAAAEQEIARRVAEDDARAEEMRRALDEIREKARAEADAEIERAREEGRDMVTEAQAVRERVLADLGRRRKQARAQIEQLRAGRDRLLAAYAVVRHTLDEATNELRVAMPEAKQAAERAAAEAAAVTDFDTELPDEVVEVVEEVVEIVEVIEVEPDDAEIEAEIDDELELPEPEAEVEPEVEVESEVADAEVAGAAAEEPEPEPVAEPEPAVQAAAPEVESEPEPEPEVEQESARVDALFARIRAARAEETARAKEVLAAEELPVHERPPEIESLLERRDAATDDVERRLARRLKRVLSDEQNEVLDRLRRGPATRLDDVLSPVADQAARYARIATGDLTAAAEAGAGFLANGAAPATGVPVDDLAGDLAGVIVGLLRDRLARGFDDASGDADELADRIRACYREWKTQRIGDTARHYVLAAFTRGLFEAAPAGERLCWVVDDGGSPCPDAEDNALAGALAKGEPFPTGHLYPPAHPGCRCLVVPEHH